MMSFEYKGKKYKVIYSAPGVTCQNHCTYCQFQEHCEEYVNNNLWFACGASLRPEPVYIVKV